MLLIPQQGREARRRVETREAQPVHRPGAPNKSGGLQIANQAIVLKKHRLPLAIIGARGVEDITPSG